MQRVSSRAWAVLLYLLADHFFGPFPYADAEPNLTPPSATPLVEFSGSLIKRVDGRRTDVQVFAKPGRIRLEYKYAVKKELGYSSIEIIRLDRHESWFLLAQRRTVLSVPISLEDVLPIGPSLPGEQTRQLLGDATAAGRRATLFEVQVDHNGRRERYYQWVDLDTGVVLKLVSQDRDWSIEYHRIRFSPQPDMYFEEPVGYTRWVPPVSRKDKS